MTVQPVQQDDLVVYAVLPIPHATCFVGWPDTVNIPLVSSYGT